MLTQIKRNKLFKNLGIFFSWFLWFISWYMYSVYVYIPCLLCWFAPVLKKNNNEKSWHLKPSPAERNLNTCCIALAHSDAKQSDDIIDWPLRSFLALGGRRGFSFCLLLFLEAERSLGPSDFTSIIRGTHFCLFPVYNHMERKRFEKDAQGFI